MFPASMLRWEFLGFARSTVSGQRSRVHGCPDPLSVVEGSEGLPNSCSTYFLRMEKQQVFFGGVFYLIFFLKEGSRKY